MPEQKSKENGCDKKMKKKSIKIFGIGAAVLFVLVTITPVIIALGTSAIVKMEKVGYKENELTLTAYVPPFELSDCPDWLTLDWIIDHFPNVPWWAWQDIFESMCWASMAGDPLMRHWV